MAAPFCRTPSFRWSLSWWPSSSRLLRMLHRATRIRTICMRLSQESNLPCTNVYRRSESPRMGIKRRGGRQNQHRIDVLTKSSREQLRMHNTKRRDWSLTIVPSRRVDATNSTRMRQSRNIQVDGIFWWTKSMQREFRNAISRCRCKSIYRILTFSATSLSLENEFFLLDVERSLDPPLISTL